MVPRSISQKISGLRFWERSLQIVWGTARLLAIVLSVFIVFCLLDWLIDRNQNTPWLLRAFLLLTLLSITAGAAFLFIAWPLFRRLSDSELSLWVEDKHPELQHRLISAVQLNQPDAKLAGMSPELVALVTREAERDAQRIAFMKVADGRRLGWSVAALVPVLAVAALLFVLIPDLAGALMARQFLLNVEIPRSVHIENMSREIWPSGEKVELRFRVTGKKLDEKTAQKLVGDVYVYPERLPRDQYAMRFAEWKNGAAEYAVQVPPSATNFTFWARLEDGRMHKSERVRFVPRPSISAQTAWLVLPEYCGVRADKKPYEKLQSRGDIAGIKGSSARVQIDIQKPVKSAKIELLTAKVGGDSAKDAFEEELLRTVDMKLSKDGKKAEGVFPLVPEAVSYRLVVTDEYGFSNVPPPRRLVRIVPEDAPQVFLLREQFPPAGKLLSDGPTEDYVVDGVPALLGGPVQIGYACEGPYGIGEVRILYRVLKKSESGNEPVQQDAWQVLKLKRVTAGKDVGEFDFNRGVFEKTGIFDQVEFYDRPLLPEADPSRKGGGRYDLKTKGLVGSGGELIKLKEGDQVEFCVEVFAGATGDGRPSARSETRVTNVVGFDEFTRWIRDTVQEEHRLRTLEQGQRGVFEKMGS